MSYLIIGILIFIGIYKFDYKQSTDHKFFLWCLVCFLMIIVAGFRYRIGGDTLQYAWFFDKIPVLTDLRLNHFTDTRYAPGFVFLASLSKTIFNDLVILQLFVSCFINIIVFYFFWNNTKKIFFACLLYYVFLYFTLNMETLREAIAVGFFLLSWPYFKTNQWLKYYLIILPCLLFHVSSVILFILPLISLPLIRSFFTFGKRTIFFCIIILLAGFVLRFYLFEIIRSIAFTDSLMEISDRYASNSLGGKRTLNVAGILSYVIRYVLYPCIAMYFLNKKYKYNQENNLSLKKTESLSLISIYISIFSATILILARFNNYFIFFSILLMSDWIFNIVPIGIKKIRFQFITWFIIFSPLFFGWMYSYYLRPINQAGYLRTYMIYYPYSNVFDAEKDANREKVFNYVRRHQN